jgi:hypothetical protein
VDRSTLALFIELETKIIYGVVVDAHRFHQPTKPEFTASANFPLRDPLPIHPLSLPTFGQPCHPRHPLFVRCLIGARLIAAQGDQGTWGWSFCSASSSSVASTPTMSLRLRMYVPSSPSTVEGVCTWTTMRSPARTGPPPGPRRWPAHTAPGAPSGEEGALECEVVGLSK